MPASHAASRRGRKRRWPRILLYVAGSLLLLLLVAAGAAVLLWDRHAEPAEQRAEEGIEHAGSGEGEAERRIDAGQPS